MTDCSCLDVYGEDPRCIKHGRGTPWGKANPDICALAEKAARVDELEQRIRAEGVGDREPLKDVTVHLIAAVSLLEKYHEACAPTKRDPLFGTKIKDYRRAIENGRAAAFSTPAAEPAGQHPPAEAGLKVRASSGTQP